MAGEGRLSLPSGQDCSSACTYVLMERMLLGSDVEFFFFLLKIFEFKHCP